MKINPDTSRQRYQQTYILRFRFQHFTGLEKNQKLTSQKVSLRYAAS